MKLNLVTVTNKVITLKQMLDHYTDIVDNIYVIAYKTSNDDTIVDDIEKLGITPYKVVTGSPFQYELVTNLYNEIKYTKPDDWWIVADDDELHIYPNDIREMITECEHNGWDFISGGFIDRIGKDGTFPLVTSFTNLWEAFPYSGFFRYPLSGACPNKVCVMKGKVQLSNGQHYAVYDNKSVWGIEGTKHPKRYPIERGFIQVHHFKWDSTILDRLEKVSNIKEDYTFWKEYKKMYNNIIRNGGKIDVNNDEFLFDRMSENTYISYKHWETLTNKIIKI